LWNSTKTRNFPAAQRDKGLLLVEEKKHLVKIFQWCRDKGFLLVEKKKAFSKDFSVTQRDKGCLLVKEEKGI